MSLPFRVLRTFPPRGLIDERREKLSSILHSDFGCRKQMAEDCRNRLPVEDAPSIRMNLPRTGFPWASRRRTSRNWLMMSPSVRRGARRPGVEV